MDSVSSQPADGVFWKSDQPPQDSQGDLEPGSEKADRKVRSFPRWSFVFGLASWIGLFLVGSGIGSMSLTFLVLSGALPIANTEPLLVALLYTNFILVFAFSTIITWRLIRVWQRRQSIEGAAKLHERLVTLFSLIAVVPAIVVAVFAVLTLTVSLDGLFGEPVPSAIRNSAQMARFYVDEQIEQLNIDLRAMAKDVNTSAPLLAESPIRMQRFLEFQMKARRLTSAYIITDEGRRLSSAESHELPDIERPTLEHPGSSKDTGHADQAGAPPAPKFTFPVSGPMEQARLGRFTIYSDSASSQFRGLVRLTAFSNAYLLIGRKIERQVFDHLRQTEKLKATFEKQEKDRRLIEANFTLSYLIIALIVLLGAVWLGLRAADNLAAPIDRLVTVAEKVSRGDLSARVEVDQTDDEVARLGRTFNRMTGELKSQRNELIEANNQIDTRRRFTEAVLAGVSAGVLGVDGQGQVTIANRSALQLLAISKDALIGQKVVTVFPEIANLIRAIEVDNQFFIDDHVELNRNGQVRHLNVRVSADDFAPERLEIQDASSAGDQLTGQNYVITFDDITKLVSAQRTAAWADVARRIAHEIRNPLTPIQLSAERLRRKYGKEISSDPSVFEQCTDTIIRQVTDIGRMVDEFSSFARMPQPVMKRDDLSDLVKQSMFSQKVANPTIDYQLSLPQEPVYALCDYRLIGQAVTNILKNAAEAIESRKHAQKDNVVPLDRGEAFRSELSSDEDGDEEDFKGKIELAVTDKQDWITISVLDNGCGLPREERDRLAEPYMTTRAKGTGLGLAIVKKIMEDHGGELILTDNPATGGAAVTLSLPKGVDMDLVAEHDKPDRDDNPSRIASS